MKPCTNCIFYKKDMTDGEEKRGFCHRYPPSVFLIGQDFRSLRAQGRAQSQGGRVMAARRPPKRGTTASSAGALAAPQAGEHVERDDAVPNSGGGTARVPRRVTRQFVLKGLARNATRAMQAEKATMRGVPTGEYRYDGAVANRALELIGKELGMFGERKESMSVLRTISAEPLTPEEWEERYCAQALPSKEVQ
jgi:hypothetical protein